MKNSKGITLIALVITIIVMLILAGVSVTVISDGDLFTKSRSAATDTNEEATKERDIASGTIGGAAINNWVDGTVGEDMAGQMTTY